MLKKKDIKNGQFIEYEDRFGIIKNVGNAIKTGRRSDHSSHKDELGYDIFYPAGIGEYKTFKNVCEHSGVTAFAKVISKEKAKRLLKKAHATISANILGVDEQALKTKGELLKAQKEIVHFIAHKLT